MKILHVISSISPRYGGPSKVVVELCKALVAKGHDMYIYTTNIDGNRDLDVPLDQPVYDSGVEIRYFQVNKPRAWKFSWGLMKELKHRLNEYDIVHIHSLYLFPTLITARYCKRLGIPYIIRTHGTLDPFLLRRHNFRKKIYTFLFERKNLNNASRIHYTSEEEKILTEKYLSSINVNTKSMVVPIGINMKDYENLPQSGSFRQQYPELENKKILLFLSRINFKKGLDILIEAMGKIIKIHDDIHLVIAGPDDDNYGVKVKKWIVEQKVDDNVMFTGMLLGEKKLAVLKDADIFVLPSYTENMGLSIVEAMACELPVIISNKVNICESIRDCSSGIIIDCDVNQLVEGIVKLYENHQLKKEMGENGKSLVEKQYSWQKIVGQVLDYYRKVKDEKLNEV